MAGLLLLLIRQADTYVGPSKQSSVETQMQSLRYRALLQRRSNRGAASNVHCTAALLQHYPIPLRLPFCVITVLDQRC